MFVAKDFNPLKILHTYTTKFRRNEILAATQQRSAILIDGFLAEIPRSSG